MILLFGIFLLTLLVLTAIAIVRSDGLLTVRLAAGSGLLLGLAALTRGVLLYFIPLVCLWLVWSNRDVRRIAAQLEVYLPSDRLNRLIYLEGIESSVYDAWLRGEHLLSKWEPAAEDRAAEIKSSLSSDKRYVK